MFSTIRRLYPVVKLPNGYSFWAEKSNLKLPNGGKKMDLGLKFVGGFFVFSGAAFYVYMQADINPNSMYSKIYNTIVTEGIPYLFKPDAEKSLDPDTMKGPIQ
ncbi:hypothetical protein FO519_007097 [Halicephalobus sp. NKZ332]|nr:hypothetical protein FO519_007097 [Halicephalobus sp. NKZ332]